jgi:hypothetical protein
MQKNKFKKTATNNSQNLLKLILKYLPCFLKGFAFPAIGILAVTFAYYKSSSHSIVLFYLIFIFIALGSFITGRLTFHKFGNKGILSGALGALPLAFFETLIILSFSNRTTIYITLVTIINIVAGALGGIIKANEKKRY